MDNVKLSAAFKRCFSTPDGEIVLQHMVKASRMLQPYATSDPNEVMLFEGRRRFMLELLDFMEKDHKYYINLMEKYNERTESE